MQLMQEVKSGRRTPLELGWVDVDSSRSISKYKLIIWSATGLTVGRKEWNGRPLNTPKSRLLLSSVQHSSTTPRSLQRPLPLRLYECKKA